tara:strand:+ start:316 stop:2280 length:1965 start_codon:yes stop_codon:yes gene_type:complete
MATTSARFRVVPPHGATAAHPKGTRHTRHSGGRRVTKRNVRRASAVADAADTTSEATRVVRLENGPGGATLHLVGVSHVLVDDTVRDVQTLMRDLRPDAVVLELCAERAPAAMTAAMAGVSPNDLPLPAVIPRAVRIEGLPKRPLPNASELELLSLLTAKAGAVVTPADLVRDRNTLLSRGIFGNVHVDVEDDDEFVSKETNTKPMYCARRDDGKGKGDEKKETIPQIYEVANANALVFRVEADPNAAVTADVRFSWGRNARRAFGDRDAVEGRIVTGALELLEDREEETTRDTTSDKTSDDAEEGDDEDDYEDDETSELWEGVALRLALQASAKSACPGARIKITSVPSLLPTDVDEGGVVWVSVSVDNERTFPPIVGMQRDGDEDGDENASEENQNENQTKEVPFALAARALRAARAAFATPNTTPAARAYLVASELALEIVTIRLDQKSPAGFETVAALVHAMAGGVGVVVLGDVLVSETLSRLVGAVESNETAGKTTGTKFAAFKQLLEATTRTVFSRPERLKQDVEEALKALGDAGEQDPTTTNEKSQDEAQTALLDALVSRRDDSLFAATWRVAGGDDLQVSDASKTPAYVRSSTNGDDRDAPSTYSFASDWKFGENNKVVVAVVGAAHLEGIAARWRRETARKVEGT